MVQGIVKKIMITGLTKYAKAYNVTTGEVQIKVTNDINGTVNYEICVQNNVVEKVRFINIMDKKIDFLGYESIANPFLKKSLEMYAKETNDELQNVCSNIIMYIDASSVSQIGLQFFNGIIKNKSISLTKHLAELGI
ncbi:MAG: hypothetical protein WCJ62_10985 [Flavobacterium sp.]